MNQYQTFLESHRYNKDKHTTITHTRIGDKNNNIYGGSYHIAGDDLQTFYNLYYKEVFVNNQPEYFTEKQNLSSGLMYVDLDFNYKELGRHHNKDLVEQLVYSYFEAMKKYIHLKN
mgnify:CR=1 FL=1